MHGAQLLIYEQLVQVTAAGAIYAKRRRGITTLYFYILACQLSKDPTVNQGVRGAS